MSNFGVIFDFSLFGNNVYYVKLKILPYSKSHFLPANLLQHWKEIGGLLPLENIHRNHRASLSIGHGIMVVLRQIVAEMFCHGLQFMVLQLWH